MKPRWRWFLWLRCQDLYGATGWRWPLDVAGRLAPSHWFAGPREMETWTDEGAPF